MIKNPQLKTKEKINPCYVGTRNIQSNKLEINSISQRSRNSSHSTSSSNSISSFSDKSNFALHAPTRLEGLEHPTLGSIGQFLFTKMIQFKWSICKPHLQNAMTISTMEKIHFVLIWLAGIPRIVEPTFPPLGTYAHGCTTKTMCICKCLHQQGGNELHQVLVPLSKIYILHQFLRFEIDCQCHPDCPTPKPPLPTKKGSSPCSITLTKVESK